MKAVDKSVIRIRAEDARAAALWTLPVVKSAHVVGLQEKAEAFEPVTVEDEIVAEKVTVSELEKIREDAYQEGLAQGRKDGLAQGVEEGREKGLQDGLLAGQQQLDQRLQSLAEVFSELEQPLQKLDVQIENLVVDLVLELSRAVVEHELTVAPEAIAGAVSDAVAQLPHGSSEVRIKVNPENVASLSELVAEHERWVLVEDVSLLPGGCKVSTSNTLVDNSVESRFEAVAKQLLHALAQPPVDGSSDEQ
ncbi:flagellar assembly protein FliH [Amphritea sp. HPY]|uniref:flagellar assembly protein FliH n=1 Tax=Amphritea sp. HPY TaxID=3421652 RepID=UPI003D7D81AB